MRGPRFCPCVPRWPQIPFEAHPCHNPINNCFGPSSSKSWSSTWRACFVPPPCPSFQHPPSMWALTSLSHLLPPPPSDFLSLQGNCKVTEAGFWPRFAAAAPLPHPVRNVEVTTVLGPLPPSLWGPPHHCEHTLCSHIPGFRSRLLHLPRAWP